MDRGHQVRAFRLRLVEQVLAEPVCVLRGRGRPGTEEFYVYVGQPPTDWRSGDIEVPPPPNKLFVALVFTIDDWIWRDKSAADPIVPAGLEAEEVLWQ